MSKTFDLVALGEAMVEFNQTVPGQPQYLQGFGGDTSNAVIAAARAGARTAYLTRVGDDAFGRELMALWRREGVDASGVSVAAGESTGIYFVTHGPSGHEFTYRRAGSAAALMTPQWLRDTAETVIASSHWLHVSGISLAISASARDTTLAAMRHARLVGTQVSLDTNLRLRLWTLEDARAAVAEAARHADLFLPSLEDAVPLSGVDDPSAILRWAHGLGPRRVVLKMGARGVLASDAAAGAAAPAPLSLPSHMVPAVDATGAGDCFAGNLIARLCAGDSLAVALRYANAAAACSVRGHGAVAPLPYPGEVAALLAT